MSVPDPECPPGERYNRSTGFCIPDGDMRPSADQGSMDPEDMGEGGPRDMEAEQDMHVAHVADMSDMSEADMELEDDVVVVLTWSTPGDVDELDDRGTDVDLHYMHPLGQWDTDPYDIFWRNETADWGNLGDEADDPALVLDDTDGAGPERLVHNGPEDGLSYAIGVHYFRDNGFGSSTARVTVEVRGEVVYDLARTLSGEGMFWIVGEVEWPSGRFVESNRLFDGFPGQ